MTLFVLSEIGGQVNALSSQLAETFFSISRKCVCSLVDSLAGIAALIQSKIDW